MNKDGERINKIEAGNEQTKDLSNKIEAGNEQTKELSNKIKAEIKEQTNELGRML